MYGLQAEGFSSGLGLSSANLGGGAGNCNNCGQPYQPDAAFCRFCGHKREQVATYDGMSSMPSYMNGVTSGMNGFSASGPVPAPMGFDYGSSAGAKIFSGDGMYSGNKSSAPMATVGVDIDGDGKIDMIYQGVDKDGDGIPDILQEPRAGMAQSSVQGGTSPSYAAFSNSYPDRASSPQPRPYEAAAPAYRTATPVRERPFSQEDLQAGQRVSYSFPTAGSFVAEPYREGQPIFTPSQPSYPSAYPERRYQERSSSPLPGRATPQYGGAYTYGAGLGASNSIVTYGAEGPGYRQDVRSYSPERSQGVNGSYGLRPGYTNGYNGYASGPSYAYGAAYSKGDTYSGGTISYGPPPGRGSYSPGFPQAGLPSSNNLAFGAFPTGASFVAEPFAPGAPSILSPSPSRTPSYVPPPIPAAYSGFGLGAGSGFESFAASADAGIASPQYGGACGFGRGPSPIGAPSKLFTGSMPGGSPLFPMPPSTASFLADPAASFMSPAGSGFAPQSSFVAGPGSFGFGQAPSLGASYRSVSAEPGPREAFGSTATSAAARDRARSTEAREVSDGIKLDVAATEGGAASRSAKPRTPSQPPRTKKKTSGRACC